MATDPPTKTLITDTFTQFIADLNRVSLDLGATGKLNTTQDSDVIGAINELNDSIGAGGLSTTASTLIGGINELNDSIGAGGLSTLASTLIGAINELNDSIGSGGITTTAQTLIGGINELDSSVGSLDSNGINNLLTTGNVGLSLLSLDSAIGNLAFRATFNDSDTRNVTFAINGLRKDVDSVGLSNNNSIANIGALSGLDAAFVGSERTSIINALNGLRADIPLIFDETGTQLN